MKKLIGTFSLIAMSLFAADSFADSQSTDTPANAAHVESCIIVESAVNQGTRFASTTVVFTGKEERYHNTKVVNSKLLKGLQIEITSSLSSPRSKGDTGSYHISVRVIETDGLEVSSAGSAMPNKVAGEIPVNAMSLNYQRADNDSVNVRCGIL
jgi:hypothetical protein